jgi:branched-subunit amino acid ABC-type transport system permease component
MDFATFSQFALSGLTTGCIYALVALGFVLCANVSSVINFAQGEYVMVGGVTAALLLELGWPLAAGVAGAVLVGAALGVAQERLTLAPVRASPLFIQVTITLGVAAVVRTAALVIGGRDPLNVPGFSGERAFGLAGALLPMQTLWVWGTTAALLIATFVFLKHTALGRAVRACSINLMAARLMGVDAERLTLLVFAISGGAAALAGAVVAPITQATWISGLDFGLKGFIGAIIGNFRSPTLAVAGGLGIGAVEALAAGYISSAYKDAVAYGVLLAYLLVRGGVFTYGRASLAAGSH